MIDLDTFEERAAIMEYCGGMTRFEAETKAAQAQGATRWEAMDAIRKRDTGKAQHQREAHVGNGSNNLPRVQRPTEKEI
jgi:hypothetical protein